MKTKTTLIEFRNCFNIELVLLISLWLLCVVPLSSCKPSEPDKCFDCPDPNLPKQPKDTIYFPQEFLDYTYFKEGSWWIYQRTDTAAVVFDTVAVVKTTRGIFFTPQISIYALEQIYVRAMHSYEGFFKPQLAKKDHWQITDCTVKANNLFAAHCATNGSFGLSWGYYFTWPYQMGNNGNWTLIDTLDIQAAGKNIRALHVGLSISSGELWLSPNIGVVKFKTYTRQVWELIDYYIKP